MSMVIYLRRVDPNSVAQFVANEDAFDELYWENVEDGDVVDFDVAWHILHFLLSGEVGSSGTPLGLIANDYPPLGEGWMAEQTALIPNEEMVPLHETLTNLSDDELKARFESKSFIRDDIYRSDLFEDEDSPGWDYVSQGLPKLRLLAEKCSQDGSAVIRVMM